MLLLLVEATFCITMLSPPHHHNHQNKNCNSSIWSRMGSNSNSWTQDDDYFAFKAAQVWLPPSRSSVSNCSNKKAFCSVAFRLCGQRALTNKHKHMEGLRDNHPPTHAYADTRVRLSCVWGCLDFEAVMSGSHWQAAGFVCVVQPLYYGLSVITLPSIAAFLSPPWHPEVSGTRVTEDKVIQRKSRAGRNKPSSCRLKMRKTKGNGGKEKEDEIEESGVMEEGLTKKGEGDEWGMGGRGWIG